MMIQTGYYVHTSITIVVCVTKKPNVHVNYPIDHSKKDGDMSILPRSFAKSRFYMFKNSHNINILGNQN